MNDIFTPTLFGAGIRRGPDAGASADCRRVAPLKTFQRLGYFVRLDAVPASIVRHVSKAAGYENVPAGLTAYDASTARHRHMVLVRSWLGVTPCGREARRVMVEAGVRASRVREDLADIINTAIEELVRQRYELPAFSALMRAARTTRATVKQGFYKRVTDAISETTKQRFTASLNRQPNERRTGLDRVKAEPGQPTVKRIKQFVAVIDWLEQQAGEEDPLAGIPTVKLNRFAAEARALNAARMNLVAEQKRHALVFQQRARACDDGAEMLIRQVHKIHNRARERLRNTQAENAERSTSLVRTLRDVALAYQSDGSSDDRLGAIGALIHNHPPLIASLNVGYGELCNLAPAKTAPGKHSDNGAVPLAL